MKQAIRVMAILIVFFSFAQAVDSQGKKSHERFWFQSKKDAEVIVIRTLEFMDVNKDGVVTAEEFYEHVKTYSFKQLDANDDGKVSRDEWLAVEDGPEAEKLFMRWDKNGDGLLTLKEFKNTPKAKVTIYNLFGTLDVNGDGRLEASELEIKGTAKW